MKEDFRSIINVYEKAVCRVILYCMMELPFPVGINKLIKILKGTKSTFIIENKLYELSAFSTLHSFTGEQLGEIIDDMVKLEIIKITYVSQFMNMPVLELTPKGEDFLNGISEIDINFMDKFIDNEVYEFNEFEKDLYNKLKELRHTIALEKDVPAYIICGDITLREIVKAKPNDIEKLNLIHGVGDKFIHNYGERFMNLLNEIRENTSAAGIENEKLAI